MCTAPHRLHDYDLILLDLQMPGTDGFQVMEGLKTIARDPYLPVIVLTAQPGHKLRALNAGAKDFLSKPLDMTEVLTRIRNMLELRLKYRQLALHNSQLEANVLERTQELREREARFRSLTELASDWYWEQDETGAFTKVSGPVLEMLGIQVDALTDGAPEDANQAGWNETERAVLRARIAAREPFLDFPFSRQQADGVRQQSLLTPLPQPELHSARLNHLLGALPDVDFDFMARQSTNPAADCSTPSSRPLPSCRFTTSPRAVHRRKPPPSVRKAW